MTITSENLTTAFGSFAGVQKAVEAPRLPVDLEKIGVALLAECAEVAAPGGDPAAKLEKLCKRADSLELLLDDAVEAADGSVSVSGGSDVELAKEFAPEDPAPAKPAAEAPAAATAKGGDEEVDDGGEDGEDDGEDGEETETAKSDDEVEWPLDLSPEEGPILKADRLTDREKPVSTDPSRRKALAKRDKKRDQARARRKGRGGRRSMS